MNDLTRQNLGLVAIQPSKRYRKEEEKPYLLSYYALLLGTQKRQAKIKDAKIKAAKEAGKVIDRVIKLELDNADKID